MNQALSELYQAVPQQTILPILVIYNTTLGRSTTYKTLTAPQEDRSKLIAVYDNSPVRQVSIEEESALLAYKHDANNGGLSAAYNWALTLAAKHEIEWLLLLDQDSEFPESFIQDLEEEAAIYADQEEVVAIAPHIRSNNSLVSPCHVKFGKLVQIPMTMTGVYQGELMAINAGTLVRTSVVNSLGGFNQAYRLDILDHWLYNRIHASGKKVAVSAAVVEHDLSALDYRRKISVARYRSIINAEAFFVATCKPWLELPVYMLRLLLRSIKQLLIYRNAKIAGLSLAMFFKLIGYALGLPVSLSGGGPIPVR